MKYYRQWRGPVVVSEEEAFDYALEQITKDESEKKEFVEWFFSGNWIEVEVNDEEEET